MHITTLLQQTSNTAQPLITITINSHQQSKQLQVNKQTSNKQHNPSNQPRKQLHTS